MKRLGVADGLDLAEPRRKGAWTELARNGVPHIDSSTGDGFVNPPFLRGIHTRGPRCVARPLGGVKEVPENALRLLVLFARCPKWDAAGAQKYRNGCLERAM